MCLAVPGRVLEIEGDDPLLRTARVSFAGVVKTVSLACASEARVGDYVLVHVGVAIGVVDEAEAARTFEYLRQMGELEGLETADARASGASPDSGKISTGNAPAPTPAPLP